MALLWTVSTDCQSVIQDKNGDTLYCFTGSVIKGIEIDLVECDYDKSVLDIYREKESVYNSILNNKNKQIEILTNNYDMCIEIVQNDSLLISDYKKDIKKLKDTNKKIKIGAGGLILLLLIL
jgi:hypothetical protein